MGQKAAEPPVLHHSLPSQIKIVSPNNLLTVHGVRKQCRTHIKTGPTIKIVVTVPAVELVVTVPAPEKVVTFPAVELVVTVPA